MRNPRLAGRYAKSLLDISIEQNSLDAVLKDMRMLNAVCDTSHDFELMLRSPIIKGDKKIGVITAVLSEQSLSELTKAFIKLLVNKGRESHLPDITVAFIGQYNELKNIRTVKLTTATPLSDAVKSSIQSKVAAFMPNDTLKMETSVDESLIGGFVLEVEDKLFDASVKKSLNDIRASVIDSSYVARI